jgi:hypothetical protein
MHPTPLPGGARQDLGHRLLEPKVRIGSDEADTAQAAAHQLAEEGEPEFKILGRPDVGAEHLALARAAHPDGDHHRHRDHPPVLAHLLEGGIQHQIGIVAAQRSGAEGLHLAIELFADGSGTCHPCLDHVGAWNLGDVEFLVLVEQSVEWLVLDMELLGQA